MKEIENVKNLIEVLDEAHEGIDAYAKKQKSYKKVKWHLFSHMGWVIDFSLFTIITGIAIGLCFLPMLPANMLALSIVLVPVVSAMSVLISKAVRIGMQSKYNKNKSEEACLFDMLEVSEELEKGSILLRYKYKDLLKNKDRFTYKDLLEYKKLIEDINYHCGENLDELLESFDEDIDNAVWKDAKQQLKDKMQKVTIAKNICQADLNKYKDIKIDNFDKEKLCEYVPEITVEKLNKSPIITKNSALKEYKSVTSKKEYTNDLSK